MQTFGTEKVVELQVYIKRGIFFVNPEVALEVATKDAWNPHTINKPEKSAKRFYCEWQLPCRNFTITFLLLFANAELTRLISFSPKTGRKWICLGFGRSALNLSSAVTLFPMSDPRYGRAETRKIFAVAAAFSCAVLLISFVSSQHTVMKVSVVVALLCLSACVLAQHHPNNTGQFNLYPTYADGFDTVSLQ